MKALAPSGLSSWWAAAAHNAMHGTTDKAQRLALALTPVRSVIWVVDDHIPPMSVDWAGVDEKGRSVSATDFANGRIIINPLPILDNALTPAQALDVVTGFAMHEASHGKHSRDRWRYLITTETVHRSKAGQADTTKEVPAFRPIRIAAYLWNLVEDVRIEAATSREWPGFAPYFDRVLDYMWSNLEQTDGESENPALSKQLKTLYMACRYYDRWREKLDPDQESEVAWWRAWQDDYLTDRIDTPTTIQRGLDHLRQDEQTAQEMDEMEASEKKEEAAGEALRDMIERLMQEGVSGTFEVCINENGEMEILDAETSGRIQQMVREELTEHKTVVLGSGTSNPPLIVRKPEEDSRSRRAYVGRPDATSAALRTALVFKSAAPMHDIKLLERGTLDDEELYRWGMGDYRVFSERIIEGKPDVFMGLLVDMSGSMSGSKLKTAQRLAQLFVWALHDQEGVETQVWGHTGDQGEAEVDIYRLWERGDPLSRLGLIETLPHANNYDGHANAYCIKQIAERNEPQRILIVLSDGLPSGSGYGGAPAYVHMRQVNSWARRQGIEVIQIAIDHDLRMSEQVKMYGEGNVIPYKDTAMLPRQLTQVMSRFR